MLQAWVVKHFIEVGAPNQVNIGHDARLLAEDGNIGPAWAEIRNLARLQLCAYYGSKSRMLT